MKASPLGRIPKLHQMYKGQDHCMWCGAKKETWQKLEMNSDLSTFRECPRPHVHMALPDPNGPPPFQPTPEERRLDLLTMDQEML